jgi:hypothetical protein
MDTRSIVMTLWNLFFQASLALGFTPEDAEEHATEQVDFAVLTRQLVAHSIRAHARAKRLISAQFRKLYGHVARECAIRGVLYELANVAVAKVTSSLKMKQKKGVLKYNRDTNPALVAGFQCMHKYVGGNLLLLPADISGIYIIQVTHNESDYFCIWNDKQCDTCEDPEDGSNATVALSDLILSEKLYTATPEEIIKMTCADLRKKIMSGHIFASLKDIISFASVYGLYDLHYVISEIVHREERAAAIANPPDKIKTLIENNAPCTLRQLMAATGHSNLNHLQGFDLGKHVCTSLGYKQRAKVEVRRDDTVMHVSLYTPDEFAKIAFLISEWVRNH